MESDHEIKAKVGKILRELRLSKKISQERLALDSDIDRTYVSLLEKGKRNITLKILFSLCKTLDIKPSEFIAKIEHH